MKEQRRNITTENRMIGLRWPDGIKCAKCDSGKVAERKRCRRLRMWRCRACGGDFSVTTGTALHGSRLPLSSWETAAEATDDSPPALQTLLGVTAPTARRISHVLRALPAPPGSHSRVAALLSPPASRATPSAQDPLDGSPEAHRLILSALRVRLNGAPASMLSRDAKLSQSHTRKCLRQLEQGGFVRRRCTHILWGYGRRQVSIWELTSAPQTIAALTRLPPTERQPQEQALVVPPEHWSVFWSGVSAGELRLPDDALYVADTMIGGPSYRARNWALTHLPVETLQELRTMRGYDSGERAGVLDAVISGRQCDA